MQKIEMKHAALSEDVLETIAAYALGALDRTSALEFEAHLDSCIICRRELDEMQAAVAVLPYNLPPSSPSPTLEARLMERVLAGGF